MKERASFSVAAIHNRSSDISPPTPLGLDELLRKLRRGKRLIFTFVAIATLLTAVGSLLLTSRYTAIAEVLVADHRATGLDLEAAMQGMPTTDVAHMSGQVRVIRSRNLASSVIDKLGLELDPEFNEALEPRSVVRRLIDELPIEDVKRMLGLARPALSDTAAKQLEREAVTDAFLKDVFAQTVETSRVIKIQFTSEDPAKAALIANALADAYINQQRQVQDEAIRRTMSWLNDRVDALRKEVKDADQAVEKFRSQSGLLQGARGERLSEQQISELSSQLMLARSRRAESEARLSQMQNLASSDAMASLAEVVNSPLISTLITQETEVKRKIAQLSEEYGSQHPVLINAKAELQDLRAKIDLEMKRIVQSLRNEIAVASASEQSLQRSLDQFGARMSKSNSDEVTLRALERDADAARSTLETFLQQAHHLNAQDTLSQPDVTLISYASVPIESSFPKRTLMVVLAVVVSGLLAVVLVLVIEQLDAGFRSSEQLEQAFGVPVLGWIPDLGHRRRNNKKRVSRYVLEQPTSSFAEAIRRAYTKLLHGRTIRTVQLTSAEPDEGKTTLALNLAQMDARLGRRVLFVDTDFRLSEVADILELRKSPGLIDVLTGRARFEDVVQTDKSGAHVLVAGGFEPFASEMLVLRDLPPLLSSLREQYDLVIVDAPPMISLVDAAVGAGFVDRTILVVRWAGTRRSVVSHALNEIAAAGGTLGGVILSMVNVKEHALRSFGDSGQYHGRNKKYYDLEHSSRASSEPLQEKNGPPEPLGTATAVEHASAEAPGERTGLSDAPIVGLPLIAPGRGLTPDALVQGKPKAVPSSPSLYTTIAGAAVVVLALVGTAVAWTLLRSGMDAPVEAGPAADASGLSPPTMAVARAPEPYSEPALAPAAAATTKAETAGPMLAEPTRKPTEAVVIPLPTEPTAADRLAEEAMGDELLAVSDVVSARLFLARAAAQGNAPAMTAMASTYDPLMLASRNVRGVHPEPREAISWYRRAAAAGDATAEGRLRALVDVLRQSGQIDASEDAALLRVGEEE